MKKFFMSFLVATIATVAIATAESPRPTRVDFTSEPTGAKVFIANSLRGITPLTLFDLKAGNYAVRFEHAGYEIKDEFFTLGDGIAMSSHVDLVPEKGLLLLKTEPAGCAVFLDGLSLGETPRLITTLDANKSYRLKLQKAGYQDLLIDVKFDGRTPLVKNEKLLLSSGVLAITTDPSGAEVTVNGISRGATPITVNDVPKGVATVSLKLKGYKDVVREITLNAGDEQTLAVSLVGLPASLTLTSVPDGARFYLNGSIQGKGPISLSNLNPGTYKVRAEKEGFGTIERDIKVANGATIREEFRLESILGRLEVRSSPAGAQVSVDGRVVGTTKSATKGKISDVLLVPNLTEGEHTVVLKCHGHAEVVKHVKVESKVATPLDVRMKRVFTPNVKIETLTGSYSGVLVNNGPESIVIEVSPGVTRSFPRTDLRKFQMLDPSL